MTDKTFNLDELNELKQAYQLIDEKLDGKEIVTPEQIRTVTMNNIGFLKRSFKKDISWSTFAFIPVLAIWFAINYNLTAIAWWIFGIYTVVDAALRFLLIRMMSRTDHSSFDLNTLLRREKTYMKADIALACLGLVFWGTFNFIFLNTAVAIAFVVLISLALITKIVAIAKGGGLRSWRKVEISEPGKVRKFFIWFFGVILAVLLVILLIGTVYNSVTVQFDPIELCYRLSYLMSCLLIILLPVSDKLIRKNASDKLQKVTVVFGILTIAFASVPLIQMLITHSAIKYNIMFPIAMSLIVLFSISNRRNK